MATQLTGGILYDGTVSTPMNCRYCTDLCVQAKGTGTYKLMGRLDPDLDYIELTGVSKTFNTLVEITDDQIYSYDVTAVESVMVSGVTGFTVIKAIGVNK